ncbi:MAG: outer membrane lipoprotein-sorting protein [Myxococcota bacterium]
MAAWILSLTLLAVTAHAETADEVIEKARAANRVDSSIQTIKMTVVGKSGGERSRELELRSRREGDVSKTYFRLTAPSDVAGTQLLLVDNPGQTDELSLYLPAYKKVNQVAGSARRGSFVGSDFSYEDFEVREAAAGKHTMVEDNADAWVIDTALDDADSSYTKIRATIRKADLVAEKIEFYDKDGLLKVLEVGKTVKDNGVSLPVETDMTNVKKGTHTKLESVSHELNVDKTKLPDETFTRSYLERGT